ncbi:MAG: magnesium transporter, partial [Candidatus Cloacimonetes bacterium]|nr:magnesium transporter [Candidatus Cloacimonadota bacterium]
MGGNAGIQSSTVVVRGLATGELQTGDLWHRLWKEMKVSLMAGLVCALILAVVVI